MARILTFTQGPDDWKALLADPEKHWRTGYSAKTLAHCWEAGDGFPLEIQRTFDHAADPLLAGLSPLLAVPEFKVPLPGGNRASQNDIFVLGRSAKGPVAIMVEGKVDESFGPTLDAWREDVSEERSSKSGKERRLRFLLKTLGIKGVLDGAIRYQLLHRAASALITGEQFRATAAVMLVHSFSDKNSGWSDYAAFLDIFSVQAVRDRVQRLSLSSGIPLFAAWVTGDRAFRDR
jgi:hypothetical protein